MTDVDTAEDAADVELDASEDDGVIDPDANDVEEAPPTAEQSLRYFGADFDVDGLVRRLKSGDLSIPSFDPDGTAESNYHGFQRRFVWPKKQMDRFVESLLLGYPVPGIFLVELVNRRYLVLDGQQRLRTLAAFYDGKFGAAGKEKIFRLEHVAAAFRNKTIDTLESSDRRLLDNTFIQATIVVPKDDKSKSAVYRLFERINSSGIKLQPQEIRVALYAGPMIRLLRDLNQDVDWRVLFGSPHTRLKDHELILRYLALTPYAQALREAGWQRAQITSDADLVPYRPPMNTFLNSYLDRYQNLEGLDPEAIKSDFFEVTERLEEALGRSALRIAGGQVNAAHTDAVLVGATLALRDGAALSPQACQAAITSLTSDEGYLEAVQGSTSHSDNVRNRLKLAVEAFSETA